MDILTLSRFSYSDEGTFGYLYLPDGSTLATVERPWLGNKAGVSCIPVGEYTCAPRWYNRGGYPAIEVLHVPYRTHILFHVANFVHEVKGCIGVNTTFGWNKGQMCGSNSKRAFNALMEQMRGQTFKLIIVNREGGIL
jgi:hypothetical protein